MDAALQSCSERISSAVQSRLRTAKHWLSGIHGPSGVHLVQLLRNSDEVLKAVLILAGRPGTLSGAKATQARIHLMAAIRCLDREG